MRRIATEPRPDWRAKVEADGLLFHTEETGLYWNEGAYYELTRDEVDLLEHAGTELHARCLDAVEHVIEKRRYDDLRIPKEATAMIEWAWENEPPSIYGRFDMAFDAGGNPRMLEYNADTPTTLLESAVSQWKWLREARPEADQFNSIWEALVEYWTWCRRNRYVKGDVIHFATLGSVEDLMTLATLQDAAKQAGYPTEMLSMASIGWNGVDFVDERDRPIRTIFKLYPWEWMLKEEYGPPMLETYPRVQWIEPIWKMILSNKAILAILWELFPDHPFLLPAYLDSSRDMEAYVTKPLLGREGANVRFFGAEGGATQDGPYGDEGIVYQRHIPLANFEGNRPVLGVWIVDGEARGLGIREADGPITGNFSRFVPHVIAGD